MKVLPRQGEGCVVQIAEGLLVLAERTFGALASRGGQDEARLGFGEIASGSTRGGGPQLAVRDLHAAADRVEPTAARHGTDLRLQHAAHGIAHDPIGTLDLEALHLLDPEHAERPSDVVVGSPVVAPFEAEKLLQRILGGFALLAA